jgi:uncharacterized OB-fold protein
MMATSFWRRLPVLSITFAVACGDENNVERPSGVTAALSDTISTVATVTWTTTTPSVGYVEFGSGELTQRTPLEPEPVTEHSATLLGLAASSTYDYRVVNTAVDGTASSDRLTLTTGDLPVGMPRLTVTGDGSHDQFTLVPILGATTAVTILDPEGRIVWYHRDERELEFFRARLSVDGKSIVYNAANVSGNPAENSELVRVALDGSSTTAVDVPLLAHDFVEHPDGTMGAIVFEDRDVGGTTVRGDKIVEVSPSGEVETVWSAWDCFDPIAEPGDTPMLGWTFANALDYDPVEQAYYLGIRNFSSIVKIDRATRECLWVLGLFASTIEFSLDSEIFLHQHQFHVRGNRIVVFDNEGSLSPESRVLEYELDFENNTARQVWSYVAEPVVNAFVLGEPTPLEGGDLFINWGSAGQLERVTPDGRSLWKLNTPLGYVFGFNTVAETLYVTPSAL